MATQLPSPSEVLTFRAGEHRLSVAIEGVREVTRMPRLSRVPHAPRALLGLANMRGTVIPVLSAAILLGDAEGSPSRLIVIEDGELLGLAVDEASQVLASDAAGSARALNFAELAARSMPDRAPQRAYAASPAPLRDISSTVQQRALVVFALGDQEFAVPATAVVSVLSRPAEIAVLPDADRAVVGSMAHGEALLPLLSLRALLNLPVSAPAARPRVLVVRIGNHQVGVLVDDMRGILQVAEDLIDPLPHALRRGHAEARIEAICRLDQGQRLVSVLAADRLLRDDITAQMLAQSEAGVQTMTQADGEATEQFLIFTIGSDEFGIAVEAVEEVAQLPAQLTRLPRAPAFVQGLMNLRGQVIPVIDQAQRFGAQPASGPRRRVIVVRTGELQAGFVVDAIADVVRVDAASISPAPDLGNAQTRVFERVANLADEQRIILIVSPRELLDRAEQDLLLGRADKGART